MTVLGHATKTLIRSKMFINDNCKLEKSFYTMSIPKVYTSHGARKLSDKDGIVWFVRMYGKIHELKRVDYLTYAQLYNKEFLAIKRAISLNETFVLFC